MKFILTATIVLLFWGVTPTNSQTYYFYYSQTEAVKIENANLAPSYVVVVGKDTVTFQFTDWNHQNTPYFKGYEDVSLVYAGEVYKYELINNSYYFYVRKEDNDSTR